MKSFRWIDLWVVCGYVVALAALGLRFARRQTNTETYFVAKRSVPPWAMGMSIVATLVTSVTFVAYPGSSYGGNWSLLVPGFMLLGVLAVVGRVIVPFYRHAVGMSAYEYFGRRFGRPTRFYASAAFALAHFSKMGFVFYLVALTINSMTGWDMDQVILVSGLLTILYTFLGGLEAVIWTDVVQGLVLWTGVFICLGYLLFLPQGGPAAVLGVAAANGKFSFGELSWNFGKPTIPVLLLYGFFWYLQKYVADQSVVQRYLVAKTDAKALRGASVAAVICVPVWTLFMLIGTCTWGFFKVTGETLPAYITKADQVFPYFLTTHLPPGVAGLILAALVGAAMCALASDLNSFSVVGVEDFYRVFRPNTTDKERLRIARVIVLVSGLACIGTALILAHSKGSALALWFTVSAIASGGLAGLFGLAFVVGHASRRGVYIGIWVSLIFTVWATLTMGAKPLVNLGGISYPWHELTIGAVANIILFVTGYLASLVFRPGPDEGSGGGMTVWQWLAHRDDQRKQAPVASGD